MTLAVRQRCRLVALSPGRGVEAAGVSTDIHLSNGACGAPALSTTLGQLGNPAAAWAALHSPSHAEPEARVFYCTQYYYFGYEGLRVTEAETQEGPENSGK